jgi:hypothetical protein
MPERQKQPRTEKTPKGMTVPVPKRNEFLGNLKKIANPDKGSDSRGSQK